MIKVEHLSKSLDGVLVLNDLSLEIKEGSIVVLLGPSGTGKTVLLKHLIGLFKADSGRVVVDDVDLNTVSEDDLLKLRQRFGYLFQEGALYDYLNVFENVAFPLQEHTHWTAQRIKQRVEDVLAMVDLDGAGTKMPSELSGGMKKRVGLARAIVLSPKILLCDEPTSGLDPIRSRDISDLIKNISKKLGTTTVITSHDIVNSMRIADQLVLLNEGRIALNGDRAVMESSREPFVREFLHA